MSEKLSLRDAIQAQARQVDAMRPAPVEQPPEPVAEAAEKKCPFCAETIKIEAIRCKHCQASLVDTEVIPVRSAGNAQAPMMAYDAAKKSAGIAYLLWFFLGFLGAHRYYAGKDTGHVMLGLTIFAIVITLAGASGGVFILAGVAIWVLVDAVLIPGMVRDRNLELAKKLGG